jgi:hypothetical protein
MFGGIIGRFGAGINRGAPIFLTLWRRRGRSYRMRTASGPPPAREEEIAHP